MTSKYTISTNYAKRPILMAWEIPASVREEFDYIDWDACEQGTDSCSFVKYKEEYYDLGDVMLAPNDLAELGWSHLNADSYWSGLAFRYVFDEYEHDYYVQIARVTVD